MKLLWAFLWLLALTLESTAQTPSPAQMGITPTTVPEVLQVLDNTKTWVSIGNVNPVVHKFTPVGGLTLPVSSVGMQPTTGAMWTGTAPPTPFVPFDNGPLVGALNQAISPTSAINSNGTYGGTTIAFPWAPNSGGTTIYYFSQALDIYRGAVIECGQGGSGGNAAAGVELVFAAGVDGVIQDSNNSSPDGGTNSGGDIKGCAIGALGEYNGTFPQGSPTGNTSIALAYTYNFLPIEDPGFSAGDGVIILPRLGTYNTNNTNFTTGNGSLLGIQEGAYVSSVSGTWPTQTLNFAPGFTGGSGSYPQYYTNGYEVYRLPKALAYNVTIEGPATGAAAQAWTTTPNTFTATMSGTTMNVTAFNGSSQICVGSVITGSGITYVGDLNNIADIAPLVTSLPGGATSGCSSAIGAYTLSTTQNVATVETMTAGIGIQLAAGTCAAAGILQSAQVTDTSLSTSRLIGNVTACDTTTDIMTMFGTPGYASSGASDALSFTNNVIYINSGPTTLWQPGDAVWAPGFRFGGMVFKTPHTAYWPVGFNHQNAVSVFDARDTGVQPATAGVTNGFAWKVPTALKRNITAQSHNNLIQHFPIDFGMRCSAGQAFNCTGSVDIGNFYEFSLAGRWAAGDNSGGSVSSGNLFARNFLVDIAELGTVGSAYFGDLVESYEGGYAAMSMLQDCINANASSYFGIYTITGHNQCMTVGGGFVYPSTIGSNNLGGPLWVGPLNVLPPDASAITSSSFIGNWSFTGNSLQSQTGVWSGTAGSNVMNYLGGNISRWLFAGMYMQDITNPSAVPSGTYILNTTMSNIYLSNNLAANIPTTDQVAFGWESGYTHQSATPCIKLSGGLQAGSTMYFDRFCGQNSGGQGPAPWFLMYNGFYNAWMWSPTSAQSIMTFAGLDFKGYNPSAYSIIFPQGLEIGGGGPNTAPGGERQLSMSSFPPSVILATGITATDAATTSNTGISVSTCTGISAPRTLVDTTPTTPVILGPISSCNAAAPVLTLNAVAVSASVGSRDTLLDTTSSTTITAQAIWGTTQAKIHVNSCTGINAGDTITNTSNSGVTVGTVTTCVNENRAILMKPSNAAVNSGDTLIANTRRQGDVQINTGAVPGGTVGWVDTSNSSATPWNQFGLISGDPSGYTWPATAVKTTIANLPACSGTEVGMNAVITNGIAAPTYLQAVSTTGTSTRKVFCDTTGWLYD